MFKAIVEKWNELFKEPLNKEPLNKEPLNKEPLNKGDKYCLSTENPFREDIIVTIVETKRGYVKYKFSHGTPTSSKISSFLAIYSKVG